MIKYIIDLVQSFKAKDLIDIAIIATFIYLILVWFKRARARYMFFGMVIMGLVYILSRFFGLYLTTMAFQTFFAVIIIMVIVIFQDDIRHFFERVGIWGVPKRHHLVSPISKDIEILCSTLAEFSREKIGALIVIQGRDPLDRHLEAGIDLDGILSQTLLESIYNRGVLSHEGAIILSHGRIAKFRCYLPLSTNTEELGHLGTRHAAALGISERTDALCLVISEEYGSISVAEEGRLKRLKDSIELYNILENYYQKRFPKREVGVFRSFLTQHSLEKIIAVVLAFGLWLAFGYRAEIIYRDFTIPIEYRNLEANTVIKESRPKEVSVTLSGSERAFNFLKADDLKVSVDMSGIKDGENNIFVGKDMIRNLVSGINVVKFEPDQIQLEVFQRILKVVPIELKTKGRLPSDVKINQIRVLPQEVSCLVPSTVPLDKITISTEPVDLSTVTETTEITPKLIILPDVSFTEGKLPEVKVIIKVEKKE